MPAETSDLRWESIVPWEFQPQITSPAAGGISNANDPPWYATLPAYNPDPQGAFATAAATAEHLSSVSSRFYEVSSRCIGMCVS
eukprot:COSAG04_NODE_57_length_30587_cov_86.784632_26_plen_84_part_00